MHQCLPRLRGQGAERENIFYQENVTFCHGLLGAVAPDAVLRKEIEDDSRLIKTPVFNSSKAFNQAKLN